MRVGTILLNPQDMYVNTKGNLPARPSFDKAFLAGLCDGESVSLDGYRLLPPSMRKIVTCSPMFNMAVTIPELAEVDLLIVSRSSEIFEGGKVFRFNDFIQILKTEEIEIWKKKSL